MLAGDKKKLFPIACLCVLLIQPAYAGSCGGPFDGANACPISTWDTILIFSPMLLILLIANCGFATAVSFMIFYLVWLFFLHRVFIWRNWRSELDSHVFKRCLWTWVPVTLLGLFSAVSLHELIFPDDDLKSGSWLVFIQMVQIIQGVLWFCIVVFLCRNLKYKASADDGLPNLKELTTKPGFRGYE